MKWTLAPLVPLALAAMFSGCALPEQMALKQAQNDCWHGDQIQCGMLPLLERNAKLAEDPSYWQQAGLPAGHGFLRRW